MSELNNTSDTLIYFYQKNIKEKLMDSLQKAFQEQNSANSSIIFALPYLGLIFYTHGPISFCCWVLLIFRMFASRSIMNSSLLDKFRKQYSSCIDLNVTGLKEASLNIESFIKIVYLPMTETYNSIMNKLIGTDILINSLLIFLITQEILSSMSFNWSWVFYGIVTVFCILTHLLILFRRNQIYYLPSVQLYASVYMAYMVDATNTSNDSRNINLIKGD